MYLPNGTGGVGVGASTTTTSRSTEKGPSPLQVYLHWQSGPHWHHASVPRVQVRPGPGGLGAHWHWQPMKRERKIPVVHTGKHTQQRHGIGTGTVTGERNVVSRTVPVPLAVLVQYPWQ
jgi:hypothetical protein